MGHINALTPAESERLYMVIKELGNVQKSVSEVLMNGYDAITPGELINNRVLLQQHMAGLHTAFSLLLGCKDIDVDQLNLLIDARLKTMYDYMHYHNDTAIDLVEAANDTSEKNWSDNVIRFFKHRKKQ